MAAVAAINLVPQMQNQRKDLLQKATGLRQLLSRQGLDVGHSQSQIVPVILGQNSTALAFQQQLCAQGFFVPAIRPPSVPQGKAVLRISLNSSHTPEMIDQLAKALGCIWSELGQPSKDKALNPGIPNAPFS